MREKPSRCDSLKFAYGKLTILNVTSPLLCQGTFTASGSSATGILYVSLVPEGLTSRKSLYPKSLYPDSAPVQRHLFASERKRTAGAVPEALLCYQKQRGTAQTMATAPQFLSRLFACFRHSRSATNDASTICTRMWQTLEVACSCVEAGAAPRQMFMKSGLHRR